MTFKFYVFNTMNKDIKLLVNLTKKITIKPAYGESIKSDHRIQSNKMNCSDHVTAFNNIKELRFFTYIMNILDVQFTNKYLCPIRGTLLDDQYDQLVYTRLCNDITYKNKLKTNQEYGDIVIKTAHETRFVANSK
jgi:hypothetical protein